MSLSAERLAIANRAIQQTFEKASVAWQAIPHWETGDPGQSLVRSDVVFAVAGAAAAPPVPQLAAGPLGAAALPLTPLTVQFQMTLAQVTAATPDALLAAVLPRAVNLAQQFDGAVLGAAGRPAVAAAGSWYPRLRRGRNRGYVRGRLASGWQLIEDSGYLAPTCLIASTSYAADLYRWVPRGAITERLLTVVNANSFHRSSQLANRRMVLIGRRQEIPHRGAGTASAGEEPVDIAVSVPPGLEVVGENAAGQIEMAVRIRFATRVKDERGVVVFHA